MSYFSHTTLSGFPIANLGAFGDLQVQQLTPVFQASFATGLRNQLFTTSATNGGSVDTNASRLRLQTGTATNGSAVVQSYRTIAYRAGQGITVRSAPMFTPGKASSTQLFGIGNDTDGYFWAYSGTSFGLIHRNASIDTFIPRTSWNGDTCDGNGASGFNWDTSKGVPTMIKYPYLGYGNIFFYVQNPDTSEWILCHVIKYANTSSAVQITNPFLSVYGQVINSGNNTNLTLMCGSVGVYIDGPRNFLGPQFGTESAKTGVTTQTAVLTLKNAITVNGATNRGMIRLRQVAIASQGGNGYVTIRIRQGATLTSPTYTPVQGATGDNGNTLTNAQSTLSVDTAGVLSAGTGTVIWNASLNTSTNFQIDLTPYDIVMPAGEQYTITAQSTASTTISVSINWQEDAQ